MEKQNTYDITCSVSGIDKLCLLAKNANSATRQFNQQVEIWRKTCVVAIYKSVEKHYKVLEAKHRQLVSEDEYGYEDTGDFDRTFEQFAHRIAFDKEVAPIVQKVIEEYLACDELKTVRELFGYMKQSGFLISELKRTWPDFMTDLVYLWNPSAIFSMKLVDNSVSVDGVNAGVASVNFSMRDDDNADFFVLGFKEADKFLYVRAEDDILVQRCVRDMWTNACGLCVSLSRSFFMRLFNFAQLVYNLLPEIENDEEETPLQYEKRIANKLQTLGFDARTTKVSGDQGADILATKNNVSFAIQCKKYSKPVGNKAVQEVNAGRMFYGQDYGVVVSNADFTQAARRAANACGIILLNDNQLDHLLEYTDE